tara:strand:+ start:615 stop:1223 length:609 start_codon:yes stop_codon:yes gene_type:complete
MDQKPFNDIYSRTGGVEKSARWYQRTVRDYATGINSFQEVTGSDIGKFATQLTVGKMYLFNYDPLTKADLPYWDELPLVVISEPLPTGFSGINLHYLSPLVRAELVERLMEPVADSKEGTTLDDKAVMRSNWQFIKNFSRFPEVRNSVKRYLSTQVRGRLFEINSQHWKSAVFLPVQQFQGASAQKVYRDTMTKPERKRRMM